MRCEARSFADDTVDVFDAVAHDALHVVMIVCRARLIQCAARIGRIDAMQDAVHGHVVRDVMHGLGRHRGQVVRKRAVDLRDARVGVSLNVRECREAAGGHAQPCLAQEFAPALGGGCLEWLHRCQSTLF